MFNIMTTRRSCCNIFKVWTEQVIISEGTQTEVELSVVRTVLWCRGDGSINTCVVVSPIVVVLTHCCCRCLTHYWWVDKQQTRCWNSDRCPFCANTSLLDHASAKGQKSRSWQEFRVLAALPQLTSRGWQQNTLFPHTANQISSTSLRKITRSLKCFFMSMIKTDFVVRSDSISLSISCSLNSCCVWRRLWGNSEDRPWM